MQQSGVAVEDVLDALQVVGDYFGEHLLAAVEHDEFLRRCRGARPRVFAGEVLEHFGTVGVQLPAGERVLDADRFLEGEQRWPDALHRTSPFNRLVNVVVGTARYRAASTKE